ncbi:hypothetical protein SNE40_001981 [Patella caerulea]|uniref:procollagen-proline 3-dioxygenase n=1 Tax=Patella caerulea TaxID=87958 RepID=A0AAN8K7N0_PATCE
MMEILRKSECIRKCKKSKIGDRLPGTSNQEIEDLFKRRKPYEYLQYCYYKLNKVTNAASAAYTYYVVNSDNRDAISNIKFYRENAGVRDTEFIDLELRPYKEHYIRAMMAYEDELWEEVVEEIEKALLEFYKEEERCRAECEGPLLTSAPLEFVSSMAEHYVSMIKCQYNCEDQLSSVFPEDIEDLLPEHYHYLQYAYYKILQADKASEAAASFLTFKPDDKIMMKNKEYFISEGYEDTHKPRPEVLEYVKRREEMRKIIEYADKHLVTTDYSEVSSVHDDSMDDMYGREEEGEDESYKPPFEHYMHRYEDVGLKIIANGNHLNGSKRFASEGFLKDEQCTELSYMIEDYYDNENGSRIISISDIFDKVGSKEDELELSLRLLLRSSELSRHYMQKYYNLTALYFKKTSIVCWGLSKESQYNKTCLPQEDGSCLEDISQLPTDDENEYMSVLYLKDLNSTADLYFLNQNKTQSRNVSSRCGRLVGMKPNEYHNVTIPDIEMRCGVVIKYTTNKKEEEKDYVQTLIALQLMEDEKMTVARKSSEEVLKELKKNGTVVSMTSNDLRDNKAFVADGLAKDGECEILQKLVKNGALLGDGYDHLHSKPSLISPHTIHEMFIGLTVNRAATLAHLRKINKEEVDLFLDLAEKARLMVEKYFNLTRPLYFDFTHLVCRTAIELKSGEERDDLSHPVHADNCILQPDGSCIKSFPAFTQRDYSAILYLNDEFEGGEFFFAHSNKTEQVQVKPRCGRLVGFDSKEFHGVKAVRKGQRCALALWFTLNPNYKELAHVQARKIVSRILQGNAKKDPLSDLNLDQKDRELRENNKKSSESQMDKGKKSKNDDEDIEDENFSRQREKDSVKDDSSQSVGESERISDKNKLSDSDTLKEDSEGRISQKDESNQKSEFIDSKSDSDVFRLTDEDELNSMQISEIESESVSQIDSELEVETAGATCSSDVDGQEMCGLKFEPKIDINIKVEKAENGLSDSSENTESPNEKTDL